MLGLILLLVFKVCSSTDVEAISGSNTTLTCPLQASSFQWQKLDNYTSFTLHEGDKYGNVNTTSLVIYNVDPGDDGSYLCSNDSQKSYIQVTVIVIALEGSTTILTCPLPGSSFKWLKESNSSSSILQQGVKYGNVNNRSLAIYNVDPYDGGTYFCKADTQKLQMNIVFRAIAIWGSNTTLTCTLQGSYSYWQKRTDSGWVNLTQAENIYGNVNSGSMTIYNVQINDGGRYHCGVNSTHEQIDVTVRAIAIWGSNITLTCTLQESNYYWQKRTDSGWLNLTQAGNKYGNVNNGSMTIYNVQTNDSGRYHCGVGSNQEQVYVIVRVNGNWGTWQVWNSCSVTCGGGSRSRNRECNNPEPAHGGLNCQGNDTEIDSCPIKLCPVNGHWGTWQVWNSCSVICGGGSRSRYRECNNPETAHEGSNCQGNDTEIESCSIELCPEELTSSPDAGLIAGGVSAGLLLLVVIVIVLVYVKRRRQTPHVKETTEATNKKLYNNEEAVAFRTEGREDQMYINFNMPNRTSSTDTDDDIIPTSSKINLSPNETMIYENITDINSCVNVDDLKGYIGRKQINEGLKEEYQSMQYGAQHPTTKSQRKENIVKNRYKTTLPYDHSRVILETDHGSGKSDYINANYIDGFEKNKCYIASQGSTKITIPDHWRMIWQNNVKKIVMLTNLEELGKAKCDRYWPVGGNPMTHGNLVLTLVTEKERTAYVTREISVMNKKTEEKRVITQHHFTAWPDHGTPDPLYLVLFHRHVTTDHNPTESSPLLVHCSAGIGRTGTYIALDALLEEGRTTGYVNIAKFLKKMRYSRMNMIQTPHQYVCLHYALLEAFTMKDTSIQKDKFNDVWRNIQSDKSPINQQRINKEFKMLEAKKSEHESPEYMAAMSTENINKNRDRNSVVMDSTRLYLMTFEKERSNFINAVQVPSYTKFVGYLVTQLPLPDTKVDFWTMIRDHSSSTIVLILNDQKEADLVYTATTDSFTCGQFTMKSTKRDQGEMDITEATLIMSKKDDKPKEIVIYQTVCVNMPDPTVLCRLVDLISTRISMSPDPVTVVSSDGAKNCGLFCAFTNAVSSMKIDETADIFQLVRLLQLRRPEFFADFEEYRLCYEALNTYIESSNVYANF